MRVQMLKSFHRLYGVPNLQLLSNIWLLMFGFYLYFCLSDQVKSPAGTEQSVSSEKLAWQKEKAALQAALRKAEAELSKVTASNENRPIHDLSNNKVNHLEVSQRTICLSFLLFSVQ